MLIVLLCDATLSIFQKLNYTYLFISCKSRNLFPPQLLNVSAIVLANLCVSYIMTSQNEEAEDLMRKIEKEEERVIFEEPNKKTFHLCIVNLVIG